jgi:hypothetical protein
MERVLKDGRQVKILKQYRNMSNNYKNDHSRIYGDLFKVRYSDSTVAIICETEFLTI